MNDARGDRIAEIAVALEGLPFVAGLYAPSRPEEAYFEVAVALDPLDGRRIAEAHYAVVHAAGRPVAAVLQFFDDRGPLPPPVAPHALVVSSAARDAARARLATRPRDVEPPSSPPVLRDPWRGSRSVLLVDPDPTQARALAGTRHHVQVILGALRLREVATSPIFDLVLCPLSRAKEMPGGPRVVLLVPDALDAGAVERETGTRAVRSPIDATTLDALLAATPSDASPSRSPRPDADPSPSATASAPPPRPPILLLESNDVERRAALRGLEGHAEVTAPNEVWDLLELPAVDWDLILCDPTWRLPSGEPVRRFVARLRPDLAMRVVLLASGSAPPHPRVLMRPISREAIDVLLGRTAAHAR